ncbi:MAG: ABC transporter permease [Deltaproteobacteria bacterium]|nr:MAG: ABC transporter permease [Deltaproteobacteria bacterium]
MTHWAWIRRRLARSLRIRFGALVLTLVVLPALFAEFVAADAPVFAYRAGAVVVFPAIVQPADQQGMSPADISARYEHDVAWWPLVRSGPDTESAMGPLAPMCRAHPLGTDELGRDLLARLVYGARTALGLALFALLVSLVLGVLLGAIAGQVGGIWDEMLTRQVEIVETFPCIVVVAVVRAVYPEATYWSLVLAIAAVRWAEVARLVRAEVVRLSHADFVAAARALGCSRIRILRRHILPHAFRPVVVSMMFGVASVVLLEASVSFLGLGLEGSWGVMIAEGLAPGAPLGPTLWAGLALVLTVGAAYLMADAVNESVDARVATTRRVRR